MLDIETLLVAALYLILTGLYLLIIPGGNLFISTKALVCCWFCRKIFDVFYGILFLSRTITIESDFKFTS
jgi:hypothetical protein